MRVAQVSPMYESVPPKLYGGTERVVSYLTEELVQMGHDVTLFAAADSQTSATLVPCWPESLRLANDATDPNVPHLLMLERVFAQAGQFDLVHFHLDVLPFPLLRRHAIPSITTLHGRLDLPHMQPWYREYMDMPLVSISDSQREPMRWANWQATVHHGLPVDTLSMGQGDGEYLVFTGRIAPEKRPDLAIEIAQRAGIKLIIAAKVSQQDREYFEQVIAPMLKSPGVEFIGEVCEKDKCGLLGGALAMLFPIDWPEPFGLVMIESMACGTPVIAMRRGSVTEIIDDGLSGFIVDSADEAVRAVTRAHSLDRSACRACFERRFTAGRMARDYLGIYQEQTRRVEMKKPKRVLGAVHG